MNSIAGRRTVSLLLALMMMASLCFVPFSQAFASYGAERYYEYYGNWWKARSACYGDYELLTPYTSVFRTNCTGFVWSKMPYAIAPAGWLRNRLYVIDVTANNAIKYNVALQTSEPYPADLALVNTNSTPVSSAWDSTYHQWRVIANTAVYESTGLYTYYFETYACWQVYGGCNACPPGYACS